jgi:hypothetical protein
MKRVRNQKDLSNPLRETAGRLDLLALRTGAFLTESLAVFAVDFFEAERALDAAMVRILLMLLYVF